MVVELSGSRNIILELSVKFLCVCGQKDTKEQNNTLNGSVRLRSERPGKKLISYNGRGLSE